MQFYKAVSGESHGQWAELQAGYEALFWFPLTPHLANRHVIHAEIHRYPTATLLCLVSEEGKGEEKRVACVFSPTGRR